MKKSLVPLGAAVALLAGCASLTDTDQRSLSGSANGTLSGAAIGAIGGETGWGAVGGHVYDREKKQTQ